MINWLFKFTVVSGVAGTLVLAFTLYNSGIRSIEQVQNKYNELTNVTTELLTDAKVVRPPTYDFDVSIIKNKIALTSTLKVANLSSEQIIKVHQTGARDTWIIGKLLKGNAYFTFRAGFTGSVEYDLKEVTFEQVGKTITAKLGKPKIFLSDIKYAEINTSGNLDEISVAKENILSTLDTSAHNFNYSLHLAAPETKTLLTQSANKADESIINLVQGVLKAAKPEVNFEIVIKRSEEKVDTVTIQNGSGTDITTPLQDILNANSDGIKYSLQSKDTKAKVVIQSVKNKTATPE